MQLTACYLSKDRKKLFCDALWIDWIFSFGSWLRIFSFFLLSFRCLTRCLINYSIMAALFMVVGVFEMFRCFLKGLLMVSWILLMDLTDLTGLADLLLFEVYRALFILFFLGDFFELALAALLMD